MMTKDGVKLGNPIPLSSDEMAVLIEGAIKKK
jgi:hypothetical protein